MNKFHTRVFLMVIMGLFFFATQGNAQFTITDDGPGIPADERERVFARFYRRDTGGHGAGLGLAIVSQIIREHDGLIRAENNRPMGAKFTIELPA